MISSHQLWHFVNCEVEKNIIKYPKNDRLILRPEGIKILKLNQGLKTASPVCCMRKENWLLYGSVV